MANEELQDGDCWDGASSESDSGKKPNAKAQQSEDEDMHLPLNRADDGEDIVEKTSIKKLDIASDAGKKEEKFVVTRPGDLEIIKRAEEVKLFGSDDWELYEVCLVLFSPPIPHHPLPPHPPSPTTRSRTSHFLSHIPHPPENTHTILSVLSL